MYAAEAWSASDKTLFIASDYLIIISTGNRVYERTNL